MAYTQTSISGSEGKTTWGNKKIRFVDVTFTGSYATGGEALVAKDFGMRSIMYVTGVVTEAAGQTTAWVPYWDKANNKLKMFGAGTGATGLTEHAAAAYAAATVGHLCLTGN